MIVVTEQGRQELARRQAAAQKAAQSPVFHEHGVAEGPSQPMAPGRIEAEDFNRPLITEGHEAASPGHDPAHHMAEAVRRGVLRPVDLSGSRAMAVEVHPSAPMHPGDGGR